RFEYTVIGDPVNEAARLSDMAKTAEGQVYASATVLELAHLAESDEWDLGRSVTLRGRSRPTRLGTPRPSAPPAAVPDGDEPGTAPPVPRMRVPHPLRWSRKLLLGALILSKAA